MKIGLLSDTHSYFDDDVAHYFEACDEIWHAGDIGDITLIDKINQLKPSRIVYGNIDDKAVRLCTNKNLFFEIEGLHIFMTHIAGYPGKYNKRVTELIKKHKPGLVICGHSHILKVMPDKELNHLHINPGAFGHHGFHRIRTMLRFEISKARVKELEVIELGIRGRKNYRKRQNNS